MSDARALLRAHRVANRIEHPHAVYSDAGKLLCRICRESIKSESLWDAHVRNPTHRERITVTAVPVASSETLSKRKLDDVEAMEMEEGHGNDDEALPKKRNRTASTTNGSSFEKDKNGTPPSLTRRASATPAQGVEISIPSRPATPQIGEGSQVSTPNLPPLGRSPLLGVGSDHSGTPNNASSATQIPISTESLTVPKPNEAASKSNGAVDEAEWAAFEAEIAATDAPAPAYASATISAPALTAEELAARSHEEQNERKKQLLDTQIADEKEEATRALEDEFDEMEQLESRVRKLKERREELRKGSIANLRAAAQDDVAQKVAKTADKENAPATNGEAADSDEDEDDDEDWDDGFRFRGA